MEMKKLIVSTLIILVSALCFEYFADAAETSPEAKKSKINKAVKTKQVTKTGKAHRKVSALKPSPNAKELEQLFKRQAARGESIFNFKRSHHIGEGDDGLLAIRNYDNLSKAKKAELDAMIKNENADRLRLYTLLAQDNKFNDKEKLSLRKNMFQAHLDVDPAGTYYFLNRAWQQK